MSSKSTTVEFVLCMRSAFAKDNLIQTEEQTYLQKLCDRCAQTPETSRKALLPLCSTLSLAEIVYPLSPYLTPINNRNKNLKKTVKRHINYC